MSSGSLDRSRVRALGRGVPPASCLVALAWIALAGAPVSAQPVGAEPAFLGVQLREETERSEGGARVTRVVGGSPAERAGLLEGDIVIDFDGAPIRGPLALTQRIHTKSPGDRVEVRVIREGRSETLEIELGRRVQKPTMLRERPQAAPRAVEPVEPPVPPEPGPEPAPPEFFERLAPEPRNLSRFLEPLRWGDKPRLGVQLVETTPELRRHLGGSDDAGVLVSKVLSGMPAEKAGLRVGDLIVAVDGQRVASASELVLVLRDKPGRTFPVEVVRDGEPRSIEVTIPEPEIDRPTGPRA